MGLYRTFRQLVHEVAKFGVIGAVAYFVDAGLANFLHFGSPKLGPLTAKGVSTLVAASLSYFANRHWTWRDRARVGLAREYSTFFLLSLVGLGITEACVGFTEYVLHQHSVLAYNLSANFFGVLLATVFRFWSFKRWVFMDPEKLREQEALETAVQ
jgi:putative flippase GtrA